ncbi:hypothetical protein [Oceanicella sp. SM1341]|uniref:hypothetical protein n=1 Tax=Oceanicella sp. SM1341 TaxID=1548889 RepID=UPI000E4AF34F|nr:hypothetical protein [Oceanicella sp. SM1341]
MARGDRRSRADWLTSVSSFATVHLRWSLADLWSATPQEFWAAHDAHLAHLRARQGSRQG